MRGKRHTQPRSPLKQVRTVLCVLPGNETAAYAQREAVTHKERDTPRPSAETLETSRSRAEHQTRNTCSGAHTSTQGGFWGPAVELLWTRCPREIELKRSAMCLSEDTLDISIKENTELIWTGGKRARHGHGKVPAGPSSGAGAGSSGCAGGKSRGKRLEHLPASPPHSRRRDRRSGSYAAGTLGGSRQTLRHVFLGGNKCGRPIELRMSSSSWRWEGGVLFPASLTACLTTVSSQRSHRWRGTSCRVRV